MAAADREGIPLYSVAQLVTAATAAPQRRPTGAAPVAPQAGAAGRVAVVDNDHSVCYCVHRVLAYAGFAAETYTSASAFLEARAWQRCDLLITDMEMPGMTGLQLLAHLTEQGASIPVLVLTGSHGQELRDEVLAAGARSFMEKPFDVRELIAEVKTLSRAGAVR